MKKIKITFISILLLFTLISFLNNPINITTHDAIMEIGSDSSSKPSFRLYYLIETYSDSFGVPKHIAYNVSYKETRYKGPLDTTYNPYLISKAGAVGPMQIIPRYATHFAGRKVTKKELLNDLELNVIVSMKMLSSHYSKYKDWGRACGVYNTGKPIINSYAKYCRDNSKYNSKWNPIDSISLLNLVNQTSDIN